MNRLSLSALLFFSIAAVAGCGSGPVRPTLSENYRHAVEVNNRAEGAFKKGDLDRALRLYLDALRLSRAIEDVDGIAVNHLNLTATYRKLGDYEKAHGHVDRILDPADVTFSRKHLSEAAYLKALLHSDLGGYDDALKLLERSLSDCKKGGCQSEGKIHNLRAKIAIADSRPEEALRHAGKGLSLSRKEGGLQEEANSLRLMAGAKRLLKDFPGAKKFYGQALEIDKRLGLSGKISADLRGLGQVYIDRSRCEEALPYLRRALSVSENAEGDEEGTKRTLQMIGECNGT